MAHHDVGFNRKKPHPSGRSPLAPQWLEYPADANVLKPMLWPIDVERNQDGVMTVAGVAVTDLIQEYDSPVYILSEEHFRRQARAYKSAFTQAFESYGTSVDVFYAGKAFLCVETARWVAQEGLSLDTCSGGELLIAEKAGLAGKFLSLHGNNKTDAEILKAFDLGVSRIVVDSIDELERVNMLASSRNAEGGAPFYAPVMLRVTPGVHAHTHEFIATAHEDQKFGLSLSSNGEADSFSPAQKAVKLALALPQVKLLGFHAHIGSQIFESDGFELAARRLIDFMRLVKQEYRIEVEELDLGGGYGIAYTEADTPRPPAELAQSIAKAVGEQAAQYGLRVPRMSIEPGRSIAGTAGFTLYTVGTIKNVMVDDQDGRPCARRYISVDGGMSDNARPVLYGADYSAVLASRTSDADAALSRIVGKHCESGDIIVRDAYLPEDVKRGDIIAVPATGAYCWVLSSNYNYSKRPAVVAVNNHGARVIIRGETDKDLLARDAAVSVEK